VARGRTAAGTRPRLYLRRVRVQRRIRQRQRREGPAGTSWRWKGGTMGGPEERRVMIGGALLRSRAPPLGPSPSARAITLRSGHHPPLGPSPSAHPCRPSIEYETTGILRLDHRRARRTRPGQAAGPRALQRRRRRAWRRPAGGRHQQSSCEHHRGGPVAEHAVARSAKALRARQRPVQRDGGPQGPLRRVVQPRAGADVGGSHHLGHHDVDRGGQKRRYVGGRRRRRPGREKKKTWGGRRRGILPDGVCGAGGSRSRR